MAEAVINLLVDRRIGETRVGRLADAELLTYCEHQLTNAVAEGLNSKIMATKRRAGGYRSLAGFKTAIYFHCGGLDLLSTMIPEEPSGGCLMLAAGAFLEDASFSALQLEALHSVAKYSVMLRMLSSWRARTRIWRHGGPQSGRWLAGGIDAQGAAERFLLNPGGDGCYGAQIDAGSR